MSAEWPAKDSEKVKKWQEDFAVQYQKANTLISTAKTVPGVTANGVCTPCPGPLVNLIVSQRLELTQP